MSSSCKVILCRKGNEEVGNSFALTNSGFFGVEKYVDPLWWMGQEFSHLAQGTFCLLGCLFLLELNPLKC